MGRLRFSTICSLDGYTVDTDGSFAWAAPDPELHEAVNEEERPVGTYLYGRRMYETMRFWEAPDLAGAGAVERSYAEIWQAADKIVYSRTLTTVTTARTRLEPAFDPAAVRALVDAAPTDVSIGGPTIAAHAFAAGIVDTVDLYIHPISVGGGLPALPLGMRVELSLVRERRFASGVVHLGYAVRRPDTPRPAGA